MSGMRERISSQLTVFHKVITPVSAAVLSAAMLLYLAFGAATVPKLVLAGIAVFSAAVVAALFVLGSRLKHVSFDGESLYVGTGGPGETKISIGDATAVTQSRWFKPYPITIRLKPNHPYGDKIVFVPPLQFLGSRNHPIVAELNEVIRRRSAV